MMNETVFGIHAVSALLEKQPERVLRLADLKRTARSKIQSLHRIGKTASYQNRITHTRCIDQLTHQANHQGIVAFVPANVTLEQDLPLLLIA